VTGVKIPSSDERSLRSEKRALSGVAALREKKDFRGEEENKEKGER